MDDIESRYSVQGWTDVERLTRHWVERDELGYLLLIERGNGERADDTVERFDIDPSATDDDIMAALAPHQSHATDVYLDRLLDRLKASILHHMAGLPKCRFRVKWMGTKGGVVLQTRTVVVEDNATDLPVPTAPMPGLSTQSAELNAIQHAGEVRERLDSHDFTRRGQELVLGGATHIISLHNDLSRRSNNVLDDYRRNADSTIEALRTQVDKMAAERDQAYATLRQSLHERDQELTRRAEVDANRDAMNRAIDRSLDVISDAVELAVAAKLDVDKEVLPALKMLAGSPLGQVLKDKRALELLSRPDIQEMLSGLIMDAVNTSEAAAAADDAPPAAESNEAAPSSAPVPADDTPGDASPQPAQTVDADDAPPALHPIPSVPDDF